MRLLVTGASGMLGSTLVEQWRTTHEVFATGGDGFTPPASWNYRAFDLATEDYRPLIEWARPDAIVHCAALTSVDGCETDSERAVSINGRSVGRLRRAEPKTRLLFISTDAVFGERTAPAREDAAPVPINVYGRSKLLGESLLDGGLAVRTTVIGWNRDRRKQSFVDWITRSLARGEPITLFDDAIFNPIAALELARELELLLATPLAGVIHVSGREPISKHAFGVALCSRLGFDPQLIRAGKLADARLRARRSADQRLDVTKYETTFDRRLPTIAETVDTLARSQP